MSHKGNRGGAINLRRVFTGIVEELGRVESRRGSRLRIGARTVLEGSGMGASIAVNGCCLTLVGSGDGWWETDVSDETYSRTNLGSLDEGDPVNLERPMRSLAWFDRAGADPFAADEPHAPEAR